MIRLPTLSASKNSHPVLPRGRLKFWRASNFQLTQVASKNAFSCPARQIHRQHVRVESGRLNAHAISLCPPRSRETESLEPTLTATFADCRSDSIRSKSAVKPSETSCDCRTRRWTATDKIVKTRFACPQPVFGEPANYLRFRADNFHQPQNSFIQTGLIFFPKQQQQFIANPVSQHVQLRVRRIFAGFNFPFFTREFQQARSWKNPDSGRTSVIL